MDSSSVVIDANLAIRLVLEHPSSAQVESLWESWIRNGIELCAPCLWWDEVTSAIHKLFMLKAIDENKAHLALEAVLALSVKPIPEDSHLCRRAFYWATALEQLAAYDGLYLALAEMLGASFWTADRNLAHRAEQVGLSWVRCAEVG